MAGTGLQFSRRTTALVTVFPCIFLANQAQALTTDQDIKGDLVGEYYQLFHAYVLLRHQDVPMQAVVLQENIDKARHAICRLSATVQSITVTWQNARALNQIQLQVANALNVMSSPAMFSAILGVGNMQVQTSRVSYSITSEDILQGFSAVPLTWSTPFADTNYTAAFGVNDTDDGPSIDFAAGDFHYKSTTGLTAVVIFPGAIPLIQGQVDLVDSIVPFVPLSLTAPITSLYQLTFYYGPANDTGSGDWIPTVTWTDPNNNNLTMTYPYLGGAVAGDINNYQSYSVPFFVKANTPIVVTGAYSGAAFPMNVSVRVVQMPDNATLPGVGATFIINAIAVHDATPCGC